MSRLKLVAENSNEDNDETEEEDEENENIENSNEEGEEEEEEENEEIEDFLEDLFEGEGEGEGGEKIEDLFEDLFEDANPALIASLFGFVPTPLPLPVPPLFPPFTGQLDPLIILPPGISPTDFTADQIRVLNNPASFARQNVRSLTKDQNGCFSGEIPPIGGNNAANVYSEYVTGSSNDFLVFAPNGEVAAFDGLVRQRGELAQRFGVPTFPPARSVAEAKDIKYSTSSSFFQNLTIFQQTNQLTRFISVANQCNYSFSYVARDQQLVNEISRLFPSLATYTISNPFRP